MREPQERVLGGREARVVALPHGQRDDPVRDPLEVDRHAGRAVPGRPGRRTGPCAVGRGLIGRRLLGGGLPGRWGEVGNAHVAELTDINGREAFVLGAFAVGVLLLGVWPKPLTDLMEPSIANLAMQIASSKL